MISDVNGNKGCAGARVHRAQHGQPQSDAERHQPGQHSEFNGRYHSICDDGAVFALQQVGWIKQSRLISTQSIGKKFSENNDGYLFAPGIRPDRSARDGRDHKFTRSLVRAIRTQPLCVDFGCFTTFFHGIELVIDRFEKRCFAFLDAHAPGFGHQ